MYGNRERRQGMILPSTATYGKFNNRRKARYSLNDVVLNLDNDNNYFNISSDTIKLSDDEIDNSDMDNSDEEGSGDLFASDIPYSLSQVISIAVNENENDSDLVTASPDKKSKGAQQQQRHYHQDSTPKRRSILQDLSPSIQNTSSVLANDINDKRIPLNTTAPTFQRNSSAGLSHLRKRSSLTSNSSKRWSLLSFNNEAEKDNSSISAISKRFSINSIHSTNSSKNKRFSITSQQSSSSSSINSFKTALNKVGNILSSVSVNSFENSNESTPYKNPQPGVVGETGSHKRSSDNAELSPVAIRQPQSTTKSARTQPNGISQGSSSRYLRVDDDTISLMSTNTTTSSLRSSRSKFRLSSIFSSSYKKDNDAESLRSLKGKSSFNDIRRSVLRLNKKESISDINRNMISLPKPDSASRVKLNDRLRHSTSVMSINSVVSRQQTSTPQHTTIADHNSSQLESLIKLTGKNQVYSFAAFLNDGLDLSDEEILIKFNEASYSEVYQVKNLQTGKIKKIFKIIPFGNDEIDQPTVANVLQEITINYKLKNYPGFIKINDSIIVEGTYPNFLLKLWDDFSELKGTKNIRPTEYAADQKYLILDLEYGGLDLEGFRIESWAESLDIFWQIVQYLSNVERHLSFEHRDLHWGNIVINRLDVSDVDEIDADLSNISIDEESTTASFTKSKLSVKLIDYTLSRLNDGYDVIFTGLDHPDFFKGKGDYQFDVYRFMRNEIQSQCGKEIDWSVFTPRTNLYWLHYILLKLINEKSLKKKSKNLSFKKLEYLAKCLDPKRKKATGSDVEGAGFKRGEKKWGNYCFSDFDDLLDVLRLGEVCGLM